MRLKIALLQLLPNGTLEGQLSKGMDACKKARDMGADIALFPEMWSDGYALVRMENIMDVFKEVTMKNTRLVLM